MLRSLRIVLSVVLLVILTFSSLGCGLGRTSGEVCRDTRRVIDYDAYMLTDDLALLFQTDRPMRTSKWIVD